MVADRLLKCKALQGETRKTVFQALGRPANYVVTSKREVSYNLGVERDSYFPIDNEHLKLRFDKQDRVVDAVVVPD
jgi:hypothetical protein